MDQNINFQCIMNRAGAIPIIQQISGALRVVMGAIVAVVSAILGAFEFIFFNDEENTKLFKVSTWGCLQVGLGLMEMIPIIGTVGHLLIDSKVDKLESYYILRFYPDPSY